MKKVLFYFNQKYLGNWSSMYNSICSKERSHYEDVMENNDIDYICLSEDDYSNKFKRMYMPPFTLFYKGNKDLIENKILGILGTVDDSMIDDLLKLSKANYTICCKYECIENATIKRLQKGGAKLIILYSNDIHDLDVNPNDDIVYLSEYSTSQIQPSEQQKSERIIYALSNDVFIKSKTEANVKLIIDNYENEKKNCFITIDENTKDSWKQFDPKIFAQIENVSDVIDFYRS